METVGFLRGNEFVFSYYGEFPPTEAEKKQLGKDSMAMPDACAATRVEISPLGSPPPLAVCEGNQVLWIADTGCGSNLVPESDVVRGVSQVVANRGVRRMMTASGEVEAPERVKFSLPELS